MVFKPINLARQSFIKTFTHGYAQSLVAASQSSSASQNTSFHTLSTNFAGLLGKTSSQAASQYTSPVPNSQATGPSSGLGVKTASLDAPGHDGGLAAYYAAWQKHQPAEEKEWHQFQFAKRIGWKAPTTIPDGQSRSSHIVIPPVQHGHPTRTPLPRSRSTTAVDELKQEEQDLLVNASRNNNAALASRQQESIPTTHAEEWQEVVAQVQDVTPEVVSAASDSLAGSHSPDLTDITPPTPLTEISFASGSDSFTEHLAHLAEFQRYAEIPPVFEAMLLAGKQPTSSAYNALLLAAINLTKGKHHVVPRALDVYADMLRREVTPDTATYAMLIELLAARALDVSGLKKELVTKKLRYGGMQEQDTFLLRSDLLESNFLLRSDLLESNLVSEDDSLTLAIRIFDTSAALSTIHLFPGETYRLLISACAEQDRIGDMVRIYADMESRKISAPTSIFAPMILAFARTGDLRSAVECYDEYKGLAVSDGNGTRNIVRKDEEVYAAVVQAYALCQQHTGGMKFLGRIEDAMQDSPSLLTIRNTVGLRALLPQWLAQKDYTSAVNYAMERMTPEFRGQALAAICIDAADHGEVTVASNVFQIIATNGNVANLAKPAMALLAMHVRNADLAAATGVWSTLKDLKPSAALIEPATLYALCAMAGGDAVTGLEQVRKSFLQLRQASMNDTIDISERLEEAIEVLALYSLKITSSPDPAAVSKLLVLMLENGRSVQPVAERLIAAIGPHEVSQMSRDDFDVLLRVQCEIIMADPQLDVGHAPRLIHMVDVLLANGSNVPTNIVIRVQQALVKVNRSDLAAHLQEHHNSPASLRSPHFATPISPISVQSTPTFDDAYDPYASSTDFRGSAIITEELEKPYGSHAAHLSEALVRLKNMRRIGRHPRYLTYAKLITAAAKENRLSLATEVLEMAKQDIPFIAASRVARHGWIAILDSMIGACLNVGKRDMAAQYHQQLHDIGAAPSANTFGLYITTLKESTKTFDEATEAVKVFHRAITEGVEPSSFLYNALIGKLGKARRIDDCLYYFAEMRNKGIRPTSVTYGTVVNALCRVSDDKFAEELFEEMESMPNYKPRPAPYNSLMQYFLTTKRDRSKVLAYYERMKAKRIEPTMHTYKLLIDTHATLEPVDMQAAEQVLATIRASGIQPEAVHYASLIHAKGCVQHDLAGARATFDAVMKEGRIHAQASLYQALFESMVANHDISTTDSVLAQMRTHGVAMTPYIANTLIHGWATAGKVDKAEEVFESLGREKREPSTYEAMTRAYLAAEQHGNAMKVVGEALRRGYPSAVANKICDLVGGSKALA